MSKVKVLLMAALVLLLADPAFAASASGPLTPSANVPQSCQIITPPANTTLADYIGSVAVEATITFEYKCRKNTTFDIYIVKTNGSGALEDGSGNQLPYELCDGACDGGAGSGASSNLFASGESADSEGPAASSATQSRPIGVRIPAGQTTQPIGTYTDTATLTIAY